MVEYCNSGFTEAVTAQGFKWGGGGGGGEPNPSKDPKNKNNALYSTIRNKKTKNNKRIYFFKFFIRIKFIYLFALDSSVREVKNVTVMIKK